MRRNLYLPTLSFVVLALGCGDDVSGDSGPQDGAVDAAMDVGADAASDAGPDAVEPMDAGVDAPPVLACDESVRTSLRVVTFNTGTTPIMGEDDHVDGYTNAQAMISDQHYGDGLAWDLAVDATRRWLSEVEPDVIVFQEIFYSDECVSVPEEARTGFVCEDWSPGDESVIQEILGPGFQIACQLDKTDKCAAVRTSVGAFRGCESSFCLDGLDGARVPDCGGGSRVGRGVIDLVDGGTVTLATMHGTSGIGDGDQSCRTQQIEQLFVDLGDGSGEPAANGTRNLVMGDLNLDPFRSLPFDSSATRLAEFVGEGLPFSYITEVGEGAPGSYATLFDIDHVMSNAFVGRCWHAGLSEGHEERVYEPSYFDHLPVVCDVQACD
ncbi:MAG: endonuclease/exonuclease/phosphatase family metal-dependent hydrolase [Polyangiales bacterium]|jgi:endonuclease/exonuclease/phosphatase family metal-dependent hydrolase